MTNRPLRVLVADDLKDLVDTLAIVLEHFGFEVLKATTNDAARQFVADDPPDAALLDIGLCRTDGFGLVKHLKATNNRPLLIAVTGSNETRGEADRLGFDHFFLKPFDPIEISDLLKDHFDKPAETPVLV